MSSQGVVAHTQIHRPAGSIHPALGSESTHKCLVREWSKEVIKEQPTPRNLSATATRVLQCTCIVAASRKDCSAIVKMIRYMYKTGCPAI